MSMRGIRYTEMSSTNALSSVTTAQDVEHVSQVETQEPPNDVPEMGREILANPLLLEHESGYPDEDLFLGMDLDEDDDGQPEEQQRNARRLDEPRLDCGWPQALWRMTEEEQIKYYQCVICWESIKGLPEDRFLRLFCGEAYCADCINTAFEFSLRFESNFPLRCACKNIITLEDVLHVVATDLIDRYDQVVPEWTSPHRTYCAHCFQYLDSVIFREDARYASCTTCNKSTCRDCKSSKDKHSGNGDTCPKDSERQQVLNLAASLNWKKCGKCGILIEKSQGCNYIA